MVLIQEERNKTANHAEMEDIPTRPKIDKMVPVQQENHTATSDEMEMQDVPTVLVTDMMVPMQQKSHMVAAHAGKKLPTMLETGRDDDIITTEIETGDRHEYHKGPGEMS